MRHELDCLCTSGNRAAPAAPVVTREPEPTTKPQQPSSVVASKKDDETVEDETSSSSEETDSESEEESEAEASTRSSNAGMSSQQRNESAMARTDIGPLLARSAEARRGSKEDSPSTRQEPISDDARAIRDNEINRQIENKKSKARRIKKAAGRVAISVCEGLFG